MDTKIVVLSVSMMIFFLIFPCLKVLKVTINYIKKNEEKSSKISEDIYFAGYD